MRTHRSLSMVVLAALAVGAAAVLPVAAAQDRPAAAGLYQRLGGYDVVARLVDTAFPRVAGHPQLRRLFGGHSQDSQVRQRQHVIDAFCQATGGPCMYTGRAMKPVHTGLGITASDWSVFIGIMGTALDEMKVRAAEKKEFLETLERFRPDVVEKP
jgi:hemoglobin